MCPSHNSQSISVAGAPIHFDKAPATCDADLLGKFPVGSLPSPFRSTVPLIDMTIHSPDRIGRILEACGMGQPSSLHFEYNVESSIGGNPSQTDLMALAPGRALAIEAKWTESRYETVSKRLLRRTSGRGNDNSPEALDADRREQEAAVGVWLTQLARAINAPVALNSVTSVVYQMIHRAASACAAGERPSLLYLHFQAQVEKRAATFEDYCADLMSLHSLLGRPEMFPFFVIEQRLVPLDSFRSIQGLRKRAPGTEDAIRNALLQGPLFEFAEHRTECIY